MSCCKANPCCGNPFKCTVPLPQHASGLPHLNKDQEFKADGGKLEPSLLFAGMPRALYAVIAVLQYGKQKYEAHSWKRVDGARYNDARLRHVIDNYIEDNDQESGLAHLAHEATNCLFQLEKMLESLGDNWKDALKFKIPPTSHKEKIYEVPMMPGCGCLMAGAQCDARIDCGLRKHSAGPDVEQICRSHLEVFGPTGE